MISEDVKALLRDRIESFEQLEILLLLRRMHGDTLAPNAVERELNLGSIDVAKALEDLCRGNLIEVRAGGEAPLFIYGPGTPRLEAAVNDLAKAYDDNRLEVMKLMNRYAIERVRTSAMRAFADAFILGGGGKKE
jgi:hypothetical protein